MLQFQPPGFGQKIIETSQGVMVYYTPVGEPWRSPQSQPSATPTLIFLHSLGGGSSAYEWSRVYPAFAATHRIIAPDLIGWGQSPHPPRTYQVTDYLAQITDLIERTQSTPAIVIASSLTGAIALRLATQRPDLVQQLILVCPAGYSEFGSDYARGIPAQVAKVPGLDRVLYQVGAANELAVRSFLEQVLFADASRVSNDMVAAYLASAQQLNAEYSALASLRGDVFFDVTHYLHELTTPTVLIWGDSARFGQPERGQRLQAMNPKAIAALHVIPNAGVLPHLERPELVIGIIQRYLNAATPGSPA